MKAIKWDGQLPIKLAGIYSDIPLHTYHGQDICPGPSVSSSGLRRVLEINGGSPKHFWHQWSGNPNCAESEDKPYFILGRAAHHMLFGQALFAKTFAIREKQNPKWDSWRTKDAKDWRDECAAAGVTCLAMKDIEVISGIAKSLTAHPFAAELLRGQMERSVFFHDHETGLWVKSRPDAVPITGDDGADLKLAQAVSDPAIINAISSHGYHQQAALFRWAIKQTAKIDMRTFSFVFAESKEPYCVRVIVVPRADLDLGHRQNRDALRLIASCIKEDYWPGPQEGHPTDLGVSKEYRVRADEIFKFDERVP